MPTDNVRKSLLAMSKHGCFDEQSRQCLLQVVQLLNNLESMSQDDNEFGLEDDHHYGVSISYQNHFLHHDSKRFLIFFPSVFICRTNWRAFTHRSST